MRNSSKHSKRFQNLVSLARPFFPSLPPPPSARACAIRKKRAGSRDYTLRWQTQPLVAGRLSSATLRPGSRGDLGPRDAIASALAPHVSEQYPFPWLTAGCPKIIIIYTHVITSGMLSIMGRALWGERERSRRRYRSLKSTLFTEHSNADNIKKRRTVADSVTSVGESGDLDPYLGASVASLEVNTRP